jgi:hypothetical protein
MRPDGVKHKKIFDDLRVRKAMAFLTPVDKIIDIVTLENLRAGLRSFLL